MTIPMLSALLSEPAKAQSAKAQSAKAQSARPRPEPRGDTGPNRKDDKDFAATMSNGARDTRTGPSKQTRDDQPARKPDADAPDRARDPRDGRDNASGDETPDMAVQDAPRRQVTIPDLPARRGADAPQADPDPNAPEMSHVPLALPDTDSETAAIAPVPTHTKATGTAQAAAARSGAVAATGAVTQSDPLQVAADADASETIRPQTTGETAQDDPRRLPAQAQPDARIAAGNSAAPNDPARNLARMAVQPPAEDRGPNRSREPITRAAEAVTAAPAAPVNAASAPVASQLAILQPATRDGQGNTDKTESLLSLDGETDGLRFDLRGSSSPTGTQHGSFASAMTRADLPRSVAMQIGDFARAMPDRPVDVSLSPEELGRVRLSISTAEGGVTLHVLAERPETLDLMRRHADQLARELADLGFTSIDLSFGKGRDPESRDGDGNSGDARGRTARTGEDTDAASPAQGPANRMTLSPSGGLDIRI